MIGVIDKVPYESTSIKIQACGKIFPNGTRALEPLDLVVKGGETIVLLGPSGCGKTTLLRIVAGLESPDLGGKVFFNEEDVTEKLIEQRNIGMVFQSYALFPNMSVYENISYGLKVRKIPSIQIKTHVQEMLQMMQIENLKDRQIGQLSGGQKQRVALARAIAVRPRVLLLDEPLTALDALLRERLRVEIDTLLRSLGITAIYVTHDQAEAMALGDRIVVMSNGKIAQIGSPREIYYHPINSFVADFVGTVNCLIISNTKDFGKDVSEILFRPEDAEIAEKSKAHFTGDVISAFFLGDRTHLVLEGKKADQITIEISSRKVFDIGDTVSIRVDPTKVLSLAN